MGVTTTADENYQSAKKSVEDAIQYLIQILSGAWGSEDYDREKLIDMIAYLNKFFK